MSFIEGVGRDQQTLFPEVLDDYIPSDHPVRFIDAYVDQLDLEGLGFERATAADTGRPGYHPGDLLKLYVYGYLSGIKRWMNQAYFLTRGLTNVRAEFSLSALAYNLKRVLAIVGVPALLAALA